MLENLQIMHAFKNGLAEPPFVLRAYDSMSNTVLHCVTLCYTVLHCVVLEGSRWFHNQSIHSMQTYMTDLAECGDDNM